MQSADVDLDHLMIASQAGDAQAHRDLLRRASTHLRAYFRRQLSRYGHGLDAAEDLLQDTLLVIHTRRQAYLPGSPVLAWIYGIARYKLIDFLRARHRSFSHLPIEDAEQVADHDGYEGIDTARELRKALATLPNNFRLPIEYVKLEGLSIAEAAARTGMSDAAIKVSIHRGMKKLAAILSEARQ